MFQSTPPRGGRRGQVGNRRRRPRVSIHAPAWGATPAASRRSWPTSSFNPRPRVGGDLGTSQPVAPRSSFNPRPRVGGDRTRSAGRVTSVVSIHAPAWGATGHRSRGARGAEFQSTPPRGGRPRMRTGRLAGQSLGFNPRPRVGGDASDRPDRADRQGFQSTPPRGGRRRDGCRRYVPERFQSTPPRGGRPSAIASLVGAARCFNPRPRVGGDPAPLSVAWATTSGAFFANRWGSR